MPAPPGRRREKRLKAAALGRERRRYCYYCKEKIDDVDYKLDTVLTRFVSEKGKIRSRHITGACRRHQRQVTVAVKRAREMALLPYVVR
jgi:small subunit ribosomal protein S18